MKEKLKKLQEVIKLQEIRLNVWDGERKELKSIDPKNISINGSILQMNLPEEGNEDLGILKESYCLLRAMEEMRDEGVLFNKDTPNSSRIFIQQIFPNLMNKLSDRIDFLDEDFFKEKDEDADDEDWDDEEVEID